jgi:hypothetical protein
MLSWRKYWQGGEAKLWRLGQREARLHDCEAKELACLHGYQTDLCLVFIEEVVDQVGAHRPHPQEQDQRCSGSKGPQEPSILAHV